MVLHLVGCEHGKWAKDNKENNSILYGIGVNSKKIMGGAIFFIFRSNNAY